MKKEDLLELGFEEINVSFEESGGEPFTYYTLDISEYLTLISDDDMNVRIFDYDDVILKNKEDLKQLINILKRNVVK